MEQEGEASGDVWRRESEQLATKIEQARTALPAGKGMVALPEG